MVSVRIPLTNNKAPDGFARVSIQDAERVMEHKWRATQPRKGGTWYVVRGKVIGGKYTSIYLHRFLMDSAPKEQVDHIDRNGLNCAQSNMRRCTNAQNGANKPRPTKGSSPYKGVYWHGGARKWMARVQKDGKAIYLGIFVDPEEAAHAYDKAAREAHAEFAVLNFPHPS